ncbi:ATP-binding protein [Mycolicibacterium litorale]|uniref:Anti-sigma regulatory factor n=1 Tax=Mycolicibacterium litorale TaxID=758802 RepID=A0AAD1INR9_9MYCO|nr:ATP-binding protein [Mycolicibacterium litorale]MCV7416933.1 ATP-binding protein [Mycolicibacterium litorale]TDY04718.1 serine/threonine-protein kinase RsbW [Mycolicibacterium litorale]BBY18146.1 anti-sigma regulatory factor [Mycolicibacterium litorale]
MATHESAVVLETTTGPDTLDAVQRTLDTLWAAHDVDEMVRIHMDLAAGEIAANIVEHSGDGEPVRLRMEVELDADRVRTTFLDDGHPSPVDLAEVRMPEELSDRGRGLAIAHRVLDELSYRRDGEGNHWTLVRSLRP